MDCTYRLQSHNSFVSCFHCSPWTLINWNDAKHSIHGMNKCHERMRFQFLQAMHSLHCSKPYGMSFGKQGYYRPSWFECWPLLVEVPICSCPLPQEVAKESVLLLCHKIAILLNNYTLTYLSRTFFSAVSSVLALLPSSSLPCCSSSPSSDSSSSNDFAEPLEDEEHR